MVRRRSGEMFVPEWQEVSLQEAPGKENIKLATATFLCKRGRRTLSANNFGANNALWNQINAITSTVMMAQQEAPRADEQQNCPLDHQRRPQKLLEKQNPALYAELFNNSSNNQYSHIETTKNRSHCPGCKRVCRFALVRFPTCWLTRHGHQDSKKMETSKMAGSS
uniref:Uncharacterized protein n=1 Tax=Globodera rostochiensis TaxID=31243 RepID=A0A914H7S4_GLORO